MQVLKDIKLVGDKIVYRARIRHYKPWQMRHDNKLMTLNNSKISLQAKWLQNKTLKYWVVRIGFKILKSKNACLCTENEKADKVCLCLSYNVF